MELTPQQHQAVVEWLAEGATLSDVQKNLKENFDLTLTYMDVRLMVLEIGATVQDKVEPPPKKPAPLHDSYADSDTPDADPNNQDLPPTYDLDEELDGEPLSSLQLTLDRLVVPGAIVSGNVTFSDGESARWLIDNMGRFGLEPATPGYRPSDTDLQELQIQLHSELKRHGYG